VRQLKNQPKPVLPEAHVDIGLTAFIPKTYIPADRQRMDVYRRLTRCQELEVVDALHKDMVDAFGEPPRHVVLLFALTEMKLLAGHFGIDKVIKHPPDVVLTVRDALKAAYGLAGAPGSLRVVDEKTIYFRPPATYLEPDTLLMVLRNLLKAAYEREKRGEPAPQMAPQPKEVLKASPGGIRTHRQLSGPGEKASATVTVKPAAPKVPAKQLTPKVMQQLEKLTSLRDQGILTDAEFEAARKRILADV
jgi:hypothetical protein